MMASCYQDKKTIPTEDAVQLLNVVLRGQYPLSDQLIDFLPESGEKLIFRDTWLMMHQFLKQINGDLSKFNEDEGWPLLILNFVESLKK
jgi:hypothetical protein